MNSLLLGGIALSLLLFLLAAGVRISFALAFVGLIGFLYLKGSGTMLGTMGQIPYDTLFSYEWTAVPLFIFLAELLSQSGATSGLFEMAYKWMGRWPGGLAVSSVVACTIFAAISGLSVAAAAVIGVIAIPEMLKRGYSKTLAIGSVASSAGLAVLIPPSVPLILYGVVAGQSIGALFAGGLIPGLLLSGLYILFITAWAIRFPRSAPRGSPTTWREKVGTLKFGIPFLVLIIAVLVPIYLGVCTPTESAGVGCLAALVVAAVFGKLNWTVIRNALRISLETVCLVMAIVIGGMLFSLFLTLGDVPQQLTLLLTHLPVSKWLIIVAINIVLLALGCVLDGASIIIILTPILVPVIKLLGFDPVWFGVVFVVNMEMALVTPPVGMNLFVLKGSLPDLTMNDLIRGSAAFYGCMLTALALTIAFPSLVLWLPSMMK